MKKSIEYWKTIDTKELKRVAYMIDKALRYGFKLLDGDTTVKEIQTVLRDRKKS